VEIDLLTILGLHKPVVLTQLPCTGAT
jgi:hypothetical protein